MTALALEWLNLLVRWTHVLAGILWIGDSFLFMWMDSHLEKPSRPREGDVVGELWMVHSGGFYELVKRRTLRRDELPGSLHWFKWQAYATWISGFLLLVVTYHLGSSAALIEPGVTPLDHGQAVGVSLALLAAGWLVYDGLWSSPLGRSPRLASALSGVLFVLAAWGVTRLFPGRAAFLQLGAMIATVMAGNVWRRIIPAQSQMLAATRAGGAADAALGARAKQRSIHNHYATLPVVFLMLSPHFPSLYGHPLNWLVLVLVAAFGAALAIVLNACPARLFRSSLIAATNGLIAGIALTLREASTAAAPAGATGALLVAFAEVDGDLEQLLHLPLHVIPRTRRSWCRRAASCSSVRSRSGHSRRASSCAPSRRRRCRSATSPA